MLPQAFHVACNNIISEICRGFLNNPFILASDASGYAIVFLSQGKIDQDLSITYTSRLLNPAEQNYWTIEK